MAEELAVAYVSLVPSAKGIGAQVAKELAPVEATAASVGASSGKQLSSGFLGQLGGVSKKAAGLLGFAGIGIAAFKSAEDVDAAYNRIRVGTGATGKSLDSLEASFRKVAASSPASFADMSTAIADLNTRTGATGATLESLATQFVRLSRLTKTDLAQDITDITRVFGDWSIKTADQGTTLDKLFRATQVTGVGLNELTQNVVQFGAPLRNLGFTFDQSIALFSKFEKEGVNIQTVLAGLRFGLKSFAQAGEEPIDALQRVVKEIKGAGSAAEANSIAFQVFGVRAGPDMAAAIREGRFELEPLIKAISGGKDSISQAAKDTQTFSGKLGILKNQAKLALAEFGTPILSEATKDLGALLPVTASLGTALGKIAPALTPAILAFGASVIAGKAMVPLLSGIATGLGRVAVGATELGASRLGGVLGSVATGTDTLATKLPAIAAGGTLVGIGLTQAGEGGVQGALGIGQMAVGGALLGSAFGPLGTVIGGVAGGIGGLTVQLIAGGESVEEYRKRIAGLGDTIDLLDQQQAGKKFVSQLGIDDKIGAGLASTQELIKKFGPAWKEAGAAAVAQVGPFKALRDEISSLAAKSPAAAEKSVAALRAMRTESGRPIIDEGTTQRFLALIDQQVTKTQQASQRKRDADTVNRQYQGSETNLGGAITGTTQALNDELTAMQGVQNFVLGLSNAQIGYDQAIRNQTKAQQDYNDALAGGDPDKIADALLNLRSASDQATAATLSLDAATVALDAKYKDNKASLDEDIATQKLLAYLAPQTAAARQPLIDQLEAERIKLFGVSSAAKATDGVHGPTIVVDDQASPILDNILGKIGSVVRNVGLAINTAVEPRASGGPVSAGTYLVGERDNGAELLTLAPGSRGYVTNATATAALLTPAPAPPPGAGGLNFYGPAHFGSEDSVTDLDYFARVRAAGV